MHNDYISVDDLIAEIADSKSSYQEVAVETLKRLCLQSCEAYGYLQSRVLDSHLSEHTQRRLGDVLLTAQVRSCICEECTQMCQIMLRHEKEAFYHVLRHHSVPVIC